MRNHTLTLTILLFIVQLGLFLWIILRPGGIIGPTRSTNFLYGQGAYTSFIRQSKEGAWKLYNPYTTRPSPSVYYHLLYVFLGKIAAIWSLDPVFVYMATRILAALALFLATNWFIGTVLPKPLHSLALLFALAVEPGPLLSAIKDIPSAVSAQPAIFSYFPQEVVMRHFGLPHHVLAEACGLIMLGSLFRISDQWSLGRFAIIGLTATAGMLLMPAYSAVIVITVLLVWGLLSIPGKTFRRMILPFTLIIVIIGIFGLFTKSQMDAGYPIKNFNLDEKRWVDDGFLLINYVSSLLLFLPGTLLFLLSLPFGFGKLDKHMKLLTTLMVVWVIGPVAYIPLTHYVWFPFANFRLVDGYAYVPMAILSALGLYQVLKPAKIRWIALILLTLIITASLFFTVNYLRQIFRAQRNDVHLGENPLNTEWGAMRYLSTIPARSGVLVMQEFGNVIPSYATVRVFLGETPGYIDWGERYFEAAHFFQGLYTDAQAQDMLTREHISYVWWGAAEKAFLPPGDSGTLYPTILAPVYQTPDITVFEVKR